jgi:cytoskeletal protein CcmA (bactofilin family)
LADGGTVTFGNGQDITLTHNADTGLTLNGVMAATALDISGNADIDGTLEADAYTVDGTALNEYIADTVGAMVTSNTESGITVAYQDGDNTLDFTIGTLNQNTTGTAAVATVATTVTITDNESTNENNAVIFTAGGDVDGGNLGLESDGDLTYNPSTGTLNVPNISVTGTQTIVNSVTMNASNAVIFEGATVDAYETTLSTVDATADRTINLPNASDTLVGKATTDTFTNKSIDLGTNTLTGSVAEFNSALQSESFATLTGSETLTNKTLASPVFTTQLSIGSAVINEAELETIDGVTAGTVAASKAVVVDANKDITGFRHMTIGGNFLPSQTNTYNLGSSSKRFNDLFLAGDTIDLAGSTISADGTGTISISADGVTLPTGSKVGSNELAVFGSSATGTSSQVVRLVDFFSAAGGLSTANATFEFNSEVADRYSFTDASTFTLSDGSVLSDSGITLFQF